MTAAVFSAITTLSSLGIAIVSLMFARKKENKNDGYDWGNFTR